MDGDADGAWQGWSCRTCRALLCHAAVDGPKSYCSAKNLNAWKSRGVSLRLGVVFIEILNPESWHPGRATVARSLVWLESDEITGFGIGRLMIAFTSAYLCLSGLDLSTEYGLTNHPDMSVAQPRVHYNLDINSNIVRPHQSLSNSAF